MSKHGGSRPGAGRKKGSLNKIPASSLEAKEQLNSKIMEHWTPIIETLLDIGLGDYYVDKSITPDEKKIYKQAPSQSALVELVSFVVGKPKQEVDNKHSGEINSTSMDRLTDSIRNILERKEVKTQ